MLNYQGERQFAHDRAESLGILIANLGTPDTATPAGLRRYLAEFLSDPRVVEIPRLIWKPILHGIILRTRPKKSARLYRKIWTEQGSPLVVIARQQQQALQATLSQRFEVPVSVALGMRYGNPSIRSALEELKAANARRILVLPLYPQYASSATGSTFEAVSQAIARWRWVPDLRFLSSYHDYPPYIEALANSVEEHFTARGRPEKLLLSFHGIPRVTQQDGDPYLCQCHKTARLLASRLGLAETDYQVTFQSRFGKAEWIQPYTSETLIQLAGQGIKRVVVVTPGFSADCLETLEEIDGENRELFLEAGGQDYDYIPALNTREDHINALAELIETQLAGWAEPVARRNAGLKDSAAAAARLGA